MFVIILKSFFLSYLPFYDRKKTAFGAVEIHRLTFDDTRDCILDPSSELLYKALARDTSTEKIFDTIQVSLSNTEGQSMYSYIARFAFYTEKRSKEGLYLPLCHKV